MFFNKPLDTTEFIHVGHRSYPLNYDPIEYANVIQTIQTFIRDWLEKEILEMVEANLALEHSLLFVFNEVDVKHLGYPTPRNTLMNTLKDTESSKTGSRFLDLVIKISMAIPPRAFEVLKGRFLYGMLYATPESNTEIPFPTKKQWADAFDQMPWLVLLPIYQEWYMVMDVEHKVADLLRQSLSADE